MNISRSCNPKIRHEWQGKDGWQKIGRRGGRLSMGREAFVTLAITLCVGRVL
jgi:hypothetical protein